ncbi:hypothetical protein F4820DRAFT_419957 [Hypoxylon rubiginosum]|uniref:Uncharacterized protein n=1 Tax=Hypoxylon rubiginosum TaxID=110542 RepID=A0ACB9Z1Q3_9PEZI|nr:hypothetical protein F4820DRAFT_419957 [Hypoxylon rubiginosum]
MASPQTEVHGSFERRYSETSQSWPKPMRSRTISNSVVEFLETRPQQAFGSEVAQMIGSQAPQYTPEIDQFVAASEFTELDYFKESEQRMVRFKETLSQFCKNLEKQKLGSRLNIEIKKPGDYKMEDVLKVAQELQSKRTDDRAAKGCLGKIRRCFHSLVKQRGTLHNLLSFIPNDSYGSVICGGFTVILSAVDRAEDLREEIYTALAEIPTQLEQTNATINLHKQSKELKRQADSVFVAIFEVLESIIRELSKSSRKKTITITLKGEQYGASITAAIETLKRALKAFQREAQICDSKRLGRLEGHAVGTRLTVEDTNTTLSELTEEYKRDRDYQYKKLEELPEQLVTAMFNQLYRFHASNPSFNSHDGTIDRYQSRRKEIDYSYAALKASSSSAFHELTMSSPKERQVLARKWLRDASLSETDLQKDVEECLGDIETLSLREKDRIKWIIESDEIKHWLTAPNSQTLAIEAETPPDESINPMTATCSFLSKTVSTNTDFPVLIYFAGLGATENRDETTSGSTVMMKSLVAQLVLHVAEHRPDIGLDFLKKKRFNQKSLTSPSKLIGLFCRILDKLSEEGQGNVVFIIIDSVSRFNGTMEESVEDVLLLLDAVEQADVTFKLLVTDLGPPSMARLQERQIAELFVPDNVDGGNNDLNMEELDMDTSLSIEDFRSSQRREPASDDDTDDSFSDNEYIVGS